MNKDSIIGLILISVLFIGYFIYTQPSQEQIEAMKKRAEAERDSIAQVEMRQQENQKQYQAESSVNTNIEVNDSLKQALQVQQYGIFANAAQGEEQQFVLENDLIKVFLSNKGGAPQSVMLKKYTTYGKKPLYLFKKDSARFVLNFFANNQTVSTESLFFKPVGIVSNLDASSSEKSLRFRLEASPGKHIDFVYTLKPDAYTVDFDIEIEGLQQELIANRNYLTLDWSIYSPQQEKGSKNEDKYSQIYYKYYQDETGYLSNTKAEEEDLKTKVRWVAFKDQFFSSILIAKKYFPNMIVASEPIWEKVPGYIKKYDASISLAYNHNKENIIPLQFYFGPNDFSTLRDYSTQKEEEDLNLDVIVDLGWGIFGWINRFAVIPMFDGLSGFISSYGIIILLMTLIIKLVLFPLTYKSYMSTAKMKVLKPQVDKINEKIPADKAMERQQATMALYRKAGVNPMGGCLPMLLQMPILFAMFRFFPVSIQLRQQSFLWADDLSSYDAIFEWSTQIPILSSIYGNHVSLFTLLMTISTILYTRMQNSMNPQSNAMPGMQTMMYLMPIMFLFFLNDYASGLSYYYFVANIFTFTQMYFIRRFVDEDKVLAKLESNKKKPKKKSGFQAKLEEMAKKQQEMQKQQRKRK